MFFYIDLMNSILDLGVPIPQVGIQVAFHSTSFRGTMKCLGIYANLLSFFPLLFSLGHPILHSAKDHHVSVERRRCYSFLTCCSHAYHGPLETSLFQTQSIWSNTCYSWATSFAKFAQIRSLGLEYLLTKVFLRTTVPA